MRSQVVLGRRTLAARISAELPTVVAADDIRFDKVGHVFAAFFAQERATRQDLRALEYVRSSAVRAPSRLQRRRLALSAHRVANPTSARHGSPSFYAGPFVKSVESPLERVNQSVGLNIAKCANCTDMYTKAPQQDRE